MLLYRGLQRVLCLLRDNYTWALSLKRVDIEVLTALLRAMQGVYQLLEGVGSPLAFKRFQPHLIIGHCLPDLEAIVATYLDIESARVEDWLKVGDWTLGVGLQGVILVSCEVLGLLT